MWSILSLLLVVLTLLLSWRFYFLHCSPHSSGSGKASLHVSKHLSVPLMNLERRNNSIRPAWQLSERDSPSPKKS